MSVAQTFIDWRRPAAGPRLPSRRTPVEERFAQFIKRTSHVVSTIVRLARERKADGKSSWSMRAVFEQLRDQPELIGGYETVPGGRRVKLDNTLAAPMARHVMRIAQDLHGYFRTR
jgi:hypothetical protein